MRADGKAVAWVQQNSTDGTQDVVVAQLKGHDVVVNRRLPTYRNDAPVPATGCDNNLVGVVWMDDTHLLLDCGGSDDRPGLPAVLSLDPGSQGVSVGLPQKEYDAGYTDVRGLISATSRSVLVREVQLCDVECDGPRKPDRAVRLGLPTGEVEEVIATAADGRYMSHVSGGSRGILYVTQAYGEVRDDLRVYLRLPGEKHGVVVTGLPSDLQEVVAQP